MFMVDKDDVRASDVGNLINHSVCRYNDRKERSWREENCV
jgi:hypothetical protein